VKADWLISQWVLVLLWVDNRSLYPLHYTEFYKFGEESLREQLERYNASWNFFFHFVQCGTAPSEAQDKPISPTLFSLKIMKRWWSAAILHHCQATFSDGKLQPSGNSFSPTVYSLYFQCAVPSKGELLTFLQEVLCLFSSKYKRILGKAGSGKQETGWERNSWSHIRAMANRITHGQGLMVK